MFVFLITISVLVPQVGMSRSYTVQSKEVYTTVKDCQAGIQELGQLIVSGLPKGSKIRIGGACSKAEDV